MTNDVDRGWSLSCDDMAPSPDVALHPADWFTAMWRDLPPLSKPGLKDFDLEASLLALKKMPADLDGWTSVWLRTRAPDFWSCEECHFWLIAQLTMFNAQRESEDKKLIRTEVEELLRGRKFNGEPATESITRAIKNLGDICLVPVLLLHDPVTAPLFCDLPDISPPAFATVFRKFVLPYISLETREQLRADVSQRLPSCINNWGEASLVVPSLYFLAAALGMSDFVASALLELPDDESGQLDFWFSAGVKELVWGLGSAEEVQCEFDRLGLILLSAEDMRAWIAHTEYFASERLRDCVLSSRNMNEAREKAEVFCLIERPEVAAHMLEVFFSSKAPVLPGGWLGKFPRYVLPALLEQMRKNEFRERCALLVRELFGDEDLSKIDPQLATVLQRVQAVHNLSLVKIAEAPIWLAEAFVSVRPRTRSRLPGWLAVSELSPIIIEGYEFSNNQVSTLIFALKNSVDGTVSPLVQILRAEIRPGLLDWFLHELFEKWLAAGAPAKDKWAMFAIGLLGSERLATNLVQLMHKWKESGHHQRAVYGLECLRMCGTEGAIVKINEIAESQSLRSLRSKAMEYMERIARERNLTREELEDLTMPTYGLQYGKARVFDYGARKFTLAISCDLKLSVIDSRGKSRPDLPAPSPKDDVDLSAKALDEWRILKRDLRGFVRLQFVRMERAMVDARAWRLEQFQQIFVEHPVVFFIARLVVWGAYDLADKLLFTFRLTDEHSYSNQEDREMDVTGAHRFRIMHPFYLSPRELADWTDLFFDYHLIAPFSQLNRCVMIPDKMEMRARYISRFEGARISPVLLLSVLEKRGWWRGAVTADGFVKFHVKHFAGAGVTAVAEYPGIIAGSPHHCDDQNLLGSYFLQGHRKPDDSFTVSEALGLKNVDPVALSEVLCDLSALTGG